MQVEKHLFRIAERSHKGQNTKQCWKAIYLISLLLGLACLIVFGIGELYVKGNLHSLRDCFAQNQLIVKKDQIVYIYEQNLQSINNATKITKPVKPINQTKVCSIYKNLNGTNITQQSQVMFTGIRTLYLMQKTHQQKLKFDNYTIILNNRSFLLEVFYGISSLIANQIISLADKKMLNKILDSEEVYMKAITARVHYHSLEQNQTIINKLYAILQVFFTYAIGSIITSLYIYVTIIAAPAVILLFLKCTPYGRTEGFFEAFKAFPWIGMHSIILRSSTNLSVRSQYTAVCCSLIIYFLVMYLGYYTVVLTITQAFFDQQTQGGVPQVLFGYLAIIEFSALIFMRTRPFMNYFPVINTLLIFFFMLYCKFSHFGFKFQAVFALQFLGISLFSWMVLKLQIPAQTEWQPTEQFVPNIKQPRAGLIPSFNLNWINALPDQWAILMPLMSSNHFSSKELSFVNQNYDQLNQYLNQQ